jgi:hypothetical protein
LSRTDFTEANLAGADLRWANLTDAQLQGVNLHDANLDDADLNRADLKDVDLSQTRATGAKNLDKAKNVVIDPGQLHSSPQRGNTLSPHAQAQPESGVSKKANGNQVKIWGLQVEKFGIVTKSFASESSLSKQFAGLSDVESTLLRHRMFTASDIGIPGKQGDKCGILFFVNFMPASSRIPLEIKWLNPKNELISTTKVESGYCQRLVSSLTFPGDEKMVFGSWKVQFYHGKSKIGEQKIKVLSPKRYEARLKAMKEKG